MSSPPQRLAILCAVAQEASPLRKRLAGAQRIRLPRLPHQNSDLPCWEGSVDACEVRLVVAGMGAQRAAIAARTLLSDWKADLFLIAGVAGALDPELRVGDVVAASEVVTPRRALIPTWVLPAPRTGRLLSLDRVLVSAAEKQEAWASYGEPRPLAVEMETAAVVAVAEKQGVAWAALRAISDTDREGLPLDFNRLRSRDGDLPTSRVALAALRQPASIPGLIRLGGNTNCAAEALASAIHEWLRGD